MNETQRQRMAQRVRTPAGAVAAVASVRQNDYDLPFLHSLSNVTADPECWQSLREAGIVDLFIDMILLTPKQNGDISVGCYQLFRERLNVEIGDIASMFPHGLSLLLAFSIVW